MKLRFPSFAIVFILVMAAAWFVVTLSRRHHASVVPLATPSFAPLATPSVAPQRQPQESLAPSATHAQTEAQPMPNPKPIAPEVLKAGGLELPVVFPDGTTPQKLKNLIVRDINLVYGHLTKNESMMPIYKKPLRIQGRDVVPVAQLNFVGVGRYFPSGLNELMGVIVDLGGQRMVIPPELVEIYASAEDKARRYPQAFSDIEPFIERINHLSEQPVRPHDLFVLHPSAKEFALAIMEMTQEQIVEGFGNRKYRRPSVIEVREMDESIPTLKGTLVAPLYREVPGGIGDTSTPMIFHEGRWKLMVASF